MDGKLVIIRRRNSTDLARQKIAEVAVRMRISNVRQRTVDIAYTVLDQSRTLPTATTCLRLSEKRKKVTLMAGAGAFAHR